MWLNVWIKLTVSIYNIQVFIVLPLESTETRSKPYVCVADLTPEPPSEKGIQA
jgi:hypothetical protein